MYHDPFVDLRWSFGEVEVQAVLGEESAVTGDVRGTVSVLLVDSRPHDKGSLTIPIKLQESQGADLEKPSGSESHNDPAGDTVLRGAAEPLAAVLGDGSSCSEPVTTALEC